MSEEKKRFYKGSSLSGTWFIKDRKDESLVAIVLKGSRPVKHSEAMLETMLDSLNTAVEKRQ